MAEKLSRGEKIREKNRDSTTYKTMGILYKLILTTLLGGLLVKGFNIKENVLTASVNQDLIIPIFSLICLVYTFYTLYKNVVILVDETPAGEMLTIGLGMVFLVLSALTVTKPLYLWPFFAAGCVVIPPVKNLYLTISLGIKRHPLSKDFFTWFSASFIYIIIAATIIYFIFTRQGEATALERELQANLLIFVTIFALCAHNLSYFSEGKIRELEKKA